LIETEDNKLVASIQGYCFGLDNSLKQLWRQDNTGTGVGIPTLTTTKNS
jgi:hypothetical protein